MNSIIRDKKKNKKLKFLVKFSGFFILFCLFPLLVIFYLICGVLDFRRNHLSDWASINRYFFGNGLLTWTLSPFNLFIDLISAKNPGIYQLQDLPQGYRAEINQLIKTFAEKNILDEIKVKLEEKKRGMVFFKWYGKNIDSFLKIPEFHQDFKYIKTVGISVFNKRQSTSTHFGPLRVTLRVLYNFNPTHDESIYIEVGKHRHYWHDNSFFIFDDTLMHKSVNDSDHLRYCMFVDVIRPSNYPALLNRIVLALQKILLQINNIFYKNWEFL